MKLPVHRIIPFSNVEGVGNRTSIFVQGCNANCLYCHNSETIPKNFDSVSSYSVEELIELVKSNTPFIRGITVSGGEATLYHKFLAELFEALHELGLTCYVDTNGFFDREIMMDFIEVTDKFLYDIKGIGKSLEKLCFSDFLIDKKGLVKNHNQRFAISNEHISNLKFLLSLDKIEEIRLVYIKGYYDEFEIIDMIAQILKDYPNIPLKIIKAHAKGLPKERLMAIKGRIPTSDEVDELVKYAYNAGIAKIIKIL